MIDYSKHSYVKIDNFSNVVNEIPMTKQQGDGKSIIHGRLWHVIYDLSLRHPEWQFVGEDSWWNTQHEGYVVKRFRIYEGNDEIGTVRLDSYSDKFEIRNTRINNALAKRNYKSTKKVEQALKIVEQFFGSKTMDERVSEGKRQAQALVSNKAWAAQREFNAIMEKLAPALATYVALNMDAIRPTLEAYGASGAALDLLVEKNEARKLRDSINDVRNKGVGTTVLLHGDRYVVVHDSDPENHVLLAASQLPEEMRAKLGVLKVVDDEDFIESVGVRVSPTTFYLVP